MRTGTCEKHGFQQNWCNRCKRVICDPCDHEYWDVYSNDSKLVRRLCISCSASFKKALKAFFSGKSLLVE